MLGPPYKAKVYRYHSVGHHLETVLNIETTTGKHSA